VNTQFSGGDDQISTYVLNISRSTAVKALVIIIILANCASRLDFRIVVAFYIDFMYNFSGHQGL
jgi:hypothetical protein